MASVRCLIAAMLLAGFVAGCGEDDGQKPDGGIDTTPLVLKNLGVTFAAYDPATGKAGDFVFSENYIKVFAEFGIQVSDGQGGFKTLAEFVYYVDPAAQVVAPADGFVTGVHDQDGIDFEIWIQTRRENAAWMLVIDHVSNPQVAVGQAIAAGDPVGNPAPMDGIVGMVEVMLSNQQTGTFWAPFAHFDPDLTETYQDKVWTLMQEWETFKGDDTLYDEVTMSGHYAGCLAEVYTD